MEFYLHIPGCLDAYLTMGEYSLYFPGLRLVLPGVFSLSILRIFPYFVHDNQFVFFIWIKVKVTL